MESSYTDHNIAIIVTDCVESTPMSRHPSRKEIAFLGNEQLERRRQDPSFGKPVQRDFDRFLPDTAPALSIAPHIHGLRADIDS